jgi:hypothetical protein
VTTNGSDDAGLVGAAILMSIESSARRGFDLRRSDGQYLTSNSGESSGPGSCGDRTGIVLTLACPSHSWTLALSAP